MTSETSNQIRVTTEKHQEQIEASKNRITLRQKPLSGQEPPPPP
ncbi:hypothetical protein AYI69_g8765, partial [Smittium culicis]